MHSLLLTATLLSSSSLVGGMAAAASPLRIDEEMEQLQRVDVREPLSKTKAPTFFRAWRFLEEKGLLGPLLGAAAGGDEAEADAGQMTVFTASEFSFSRLLPADVSDPFRFDPSLQSRLLSTQLVLGRLDAEKALAGAGPGAETRAATVGGLDIVLRRAADDKGSDADKGGDGSSGSGAGLTANGVPVDLIYRTERSVLYLLRSLLWIDRTDVQEALERLEPEDCGC